MGIAGASADSLAGMAGYDTHNAGLYAGLGLGGLGRSRIGVGLAARPGLRGNAAGGLKSVATLAGSQAPRAGTMASKVQQGMGLAGTAAGVGEFGHRYMAQGAINSGEALAQSQGFDPKLPIANQLEARLQALLQSEGPNWSTSTWPTTVSTRSKSKTSPQGLMASVASWAGSTRPMTGSTRTCPS